MTLARRPSRRWRIYSRDKTECYSFETDSGKADMITGKIVAKHINGRRWSLCNGTGGRRGLSPDYLFQRNVPIFGWMVGNVKSGIDGNSERQKEQRHLLILYQGRTMP
jgi:hypothetical protein